ncbi:MAG: TolC family protein, partial [Calditrichota bacterium]
SQSVQAVADASNAMRWPTLGVNGAYQYTSETQQLKIALPIPGVTMPSVKFGDGNVYDFALTARAPLFAGGTVLQKSKADASAFRAAQQDVIADSLKLLYDVRRAYFNALAAEAREQAAENANDRLTRHVKEIEKIKAAGMQTEENLIAAQASLRQTEVVALNARVAVKTARIALGNLVDVQCRPVPPAGSLDSSLVPNYDIGYQHPFESRAEIVALDARIEQTDHLAKSTGGSLLPSLSAMAAYHYAKPGVDVVSNDWMDYYVLGVNASWTLWDWNARRYNVQQVKAMSRSLQARKSNALNGLRTRFHMAWETVFAAQATQRMTAERTELQQQRLTMVENRWRGGLATESEYLDAQDDLTSAEADLAAATAALRLAETDALYASGF